MPQGRLVSVGTHRLHILELGSGRPTVVLEAGLAASSLSWARVQPLIGDFAKVVSYDRAGLGWSSRCPDSRSLREMADDLAELLKQAELDPPYILVGHSFGGLIVRAFAYAHPQQVAGVVLVDPVSVRNWADCSDSDRKRLATGARLSRRGAWLARLGVVKLAIKAASWKSKRVTQGIARASAGNATPFLARLVGEVRKLPADLIPVVGAQWSLAKPFSAMAVYLESLPACAAEAVNMPLDPKIRLVVLSAATATVSEIAEREQWASRSVDGRHSQIEGTGHWLHLERPELVAAAVEELAEQIKQTGYAER